MGGGKFKNWILVAQPWAWLASVSPALIAYSYVFWLYKTGQHQGEANWMLGVIGFIAMLIIHVSGNTMNEYQDFIKGVDVKEKTGPRRLLVEGIFKSKTVLYYSLTMLTIGCLIGVYLITQTGWPLLIIGIIGVLSVLLYHVFKYAALGELLIYICYAMAIPMGIGYVLTSELIWSILIISIPIGFIDTNILHANNTRDVNEDKGGKISTQAMRLGLEGSQIVYQTLILASYILIAIFVSINMLPALTFLVLISFPLANKNIKLMKSATDNDLEPIHFLDARTAQLAFIFSLLFSAGNFIAPYL